MIAEAPAANATAATPGSTVLLATPHGDPGTPAAWLIRVLTGVGIKPAELPLHDIREPRADSATIVCDGKGGYRVDLQAWAGAPCGLETCIRAHEESHIADWKGRWPDGCKDKANGAKIPLGGPGYDDFLKASECRAYTAELACNGRLLDAAKGDCVKTITDHRKADVAEQKQYCG